jgi:hypothetical protein
MVRTIEVTKLNYNAASKRSLADLVLIALLNIPTPNSFTFKPDTCLYVKNDITYSENFNSDTSSANVTLSGGVPMLNGYLKSTVSSGGCIYYHVEFKDNDFVLINTQATLIDLNSSNMHKLQTILPAPTAKKNLTSAAVKVEFVDQVAPYFFYD